MSYLALVSFELHKGQLDNWKTLSKEIDADIAKADGFISRDSGMDEQGRVYCIVKWQSKAHQEAFLQELRERDKWEQMHDHFASIANMQTMQPKNLEIF